MRLVPCVVLAVACSTSPRTTAPERVKDDVAPSPPAAEAGAPTASADAPPAGRDPDVEEALHALASEHGAPDIRPLAWWKAHAAEVRPYLRAMLEDGKDDGQADRWAMQILGDIGDAADVAVLATVLGTWKADTARERAAAALGVHPAPAAGEALITATNDSNLDTASYATSGLGSRKGDDAARARLEELLNHADQTMRFRAVNALAELGGSKAALEGRKKLEKDAEVKGALVKALKALNRR